MEKKMTNVENSEYDEDGIPKLEYIQVGEFLLPNLALDKVDGYIGRWGMMRKRYLQEHKPAVYSSMLLMDELNQHLIDIQKNADDRMDVLEEQLLKNDPAPDKAKDGMAWRQSEKMWGDAKEKFDKEKNAEFEIMSKKVKGNIVKFGIFFFSTALLSLKVDWLTVFHNMAEWMHNLGAIFVGIFS